MKLLYIINYAETLPEIVIKLFVTSFNFVVIFLNLC